MGIKLRRGSVLGALLVLAGCRAIAGIYDIPDDTGADGGVVSGGDAARTTGSNGDNASGGKGTTSGTSNGGQRTGSHSTTSGATGPSVSGGASTGTGTGAGTGTGSQTTQQTSETSGNTSQESTSGSSEESASSNSHESESSFSTGVSSMSSFSSASSHSSASPPYPPIHCGSTSVSSQEVCCDMNGTVAAMSEQEAAQNCVAGGDMVVFTAECGSSADCAGGSTCCVDLCGQTGSSTCSSTGICPPNYLPTCGGAGDAMGDGTCSQWPSMFVSGLGASVYGTFSCGTTSTGLP